MYQKDIENKFKIDQNIFQGNLKEKLRKRCKMSEVNKKLVEKVSVSEFKKSVENIENNFKLLEARVIHSINVMKVDHTRNMEKKADSREIDILQKAKADKDQLQILIDRMDSLE